MYHDGPDLAALGYDKQTAVYDISAHAVYLPSGIRLEAHSGMGSLMDDPEHVSERMVGATPPAVYDLKPRERLFHGVAALRMTPVDASATLGRSGLLTHSFMLGPTGPIQRLRLDQELRRLPEGVSRRRIQSPRRGAKPERCDVGAAACGLATLVRHFRASRVAIDRDRARTTAPA